MFFLHIQTLHRMQEQPQYAGFSGGVAGDSPSPSPAYPPSSHVSSHHPDPGPGFLSPPGPLYPPTSKSVLSYMGASGHMASSSLLPPQPPSPSSSWQSTPPTSSQVFTLYQCSVVTNSKFHHNTAYCIQYRQLQFTGVLKQKPNFLNCSTGLSTDS